MLGRPHTSTRPPEFEHALPLAALFVPLFLTALFVEAVEPRAAGADRRSHGRRSPGTRVVPAQTGCSPGGSTPPPVEPPPRLSRPVRQDRGSAGRPRRDTPASDRQHAGDPRKPPAACGAGRGSRSSASWPGSKSTRIPPWPRAQPTVPHEQRIVILLLSAVRGRHPLSWLVDGCEQSCVRADQSRALLSDQRALNIATRLDPLIAVADRQRMVLGRWSNGCVRHPERV